MAKIALILDSDFEDAEFRVPYDTLKAAGHEVAIIGIEAGKQVKGKKGKEAAKTEKAIDDVSVEDFDALVIPGGYSPDHLRANERMVEFVRDFYEEGKTVAAICHAPWMLAEADLLHGKTITSWPSIKTDLINAGANWIDREVVEDGNLITSRKPQDVEAFSKKILDQLEHGAAQPEAASYAQATQSPPSPH